MTMANAKMDGFLMVTVILMVYFVMVDGGRTECLPIHAQAHGVNLVCCSKERPVNDDCQYRPLCQSNTCQCHVTVGPDLKCHSRIGTENPPGVPYWTDHSTPPVFAFDCFAPNFPNSQAEFHLQLTAFNASRYTIFLKGMSTYNVTALSIEAPADNFPPTFNETTFSTLFPNLRSVTIKTTRLADDKVVDIGSLETLINGLKHLQSLTLINVGFAWGMEEPAYLPTLKRVHIENSPNMTYLPKWFAYAVGLARLTIKRTGLASAVVVSQLRGLELLNLEGNALTELNTILFASTGLIEVNLSRNNITSFGAHTFLQCAPLRILDLSHNQLTALPEKAFQLNDRLKVLNLNHNYLSQLKLEHFVGLTTLRTLNLAHNPIQSVDPFAFLPLAKALRALNFNSCNLTRIPLAVTQCCHLEMLDLADNKLYNSDSMPPEVLALTAGLKHLGFERNPLLRLPEGLFLIPESNQAMLLEVLDTLIQLPVWRKEPCTPYLWHLHLTNSSIPLRRKTALWNPDRMRREGLSHCEFLYERVLENLILYRELAENSGCEANRRLRRVRDSCAKNKKKGKKQPKPTIPPESPSGVHIVEVPASEMLDDRNPADASGILLGSLLANGIFVIAFMMGAVYVVVSRIAERKHLDSQRKGFEIIAE
uniref:LRRCT domain-containing protein n=1 Tax=Panagrellus redivivus TaxID=6233 RepID=A0A7E4VDJ7_PANRE